MKKIYPVFFVAVVFSFSAIMLIFSLLCSIKLSALNDSVNKASARLTEVKTETERLVAEYESLVSIEELEHYAVEKLGMQHATAIQIEYLEIG